MTTNDSFGEPEAAVLVDKPMLTGSAAIYRLELLRGAYTISTDVTGECAFGLVAVAAGL